MTRSPPKRLLDLGFRRHPFSFLSAEEMSSQELEETFVAHPDFDRLIMDLGRNTVLLAPRGGGKTASRRRLEAVLNARLEKTLLGTGIGEEPRTPLTVVYNDFGGALNCLPDLHLQTHLKPLLEKIAENTFDFCTKHQDLFRALPRAEQAWWWGFYYAYLAGDTLESRLEQEGNEDLHATYREKDEYPIPFRNNSSFGAVLKSVFSRLERMGFDAVFILVDGLDGYYETRDHEALATLSAPLLNSHELFISGVTWKFFLPDILEDTVLRSSGIQTLRLGLMRMVWDEELLTQFLRQRLEWASKDGGNHKRGEIQELAAICEQQLRKTVEDDLERVLAGLALDDPAGPPRALLDMTARLFSEETGSGFLSLQEWYTFISQEKNRRMSMNSLQQLSDFDREELGDLIGEIHKIKEMEKQYRRKLLYEADPRLSGKYRDEMEDLRQLSKEYEDRYLKISQRLEKQRDVYSAQYPHELTVSSRDKLTGKELLLDIRNQLNIVQASVDQGIQLTQVGFVQVLNHLNTQQRELLAHFDESEASTLEAMAFIIQRLDKNEQALASMVEEALDACEISDAEMLVLLQGLERSLSALEQRGSSTVNLELKQIIADPHLEASLKLKYAIPLIPLVLTLEGEVGLSEGLNLRAAWERLISRLRGKSSI